MGTLLKCNEVRAASLLGHQLCEKVQPGQWRAVLINLPCILSPRELHRISPPIHPQYCTGILKVPYVLGDRPNLSCV